MPPQENLSNVTPVPQQQTPHEPPKFALFTHSPLALAGALAVIVVIGAVLYWYQPLISGPAATEPPKTYVIGILYFPQQTDAVLAFQKKMEELGYKEGVNARYDMVRVSPSPTMIEEFTAAVDRMIRERVDLIYATFEHEADVAIRETKKYQSDIPIVFITRFHDPIQFGLIPSYKSSGSNATGVATNVSETVERSLGFFKAINPNFKRVGIFTDGFMLPDIGDALVAEVRKQAPKFGVEVVEYKTSVPPPEAEAEFYRVAAKIKKGDIDGIFHVAGHFFEMQEAAESELAVRLGIPMEAPNEDLPNGGMFSYSDEASAAGTQAAVLADKIFKGTKPADIPVEFNAKTELALILGRARDAGITFPDSMLFIATNKYESGSDFPEILHER